MLGQPQQTQQRRAQAPMAASWTGRCVGVSDGDTIKVMLQGRAVTVRLYGVDSPEKKQAFGERAKQFTSQAVFGKPVTVYSKGSDRYGRTLGWVFVGKACLNAELIRSGHAWWYKQFSPKEIKLQQLETEARTARRGLWVDAAPVAPWAFRKK